MIGLAVAHLLGGISKVVRPQHNLQSYWVSVVWFFALIFVNVGWWYALWNLLRDLEELSFPLFVFPFLISMVLYVASRLLVPDFDRDHPTDLKTHFFEIRSAFFWCLALVFSSGPAFSSLAVSQPVNSTLGILTTFALLILSVAGALVAHQRFQEALCVVWGVVYLTQEIVESVIR